MSAVLIVDDEKQLTQLMHGKLSEFGYSVDEYNASKGAFEYAKQNKPKIVILDIMLGDGAGFEVARKIRRDPELYLVPILFISTLGEKREVEHALDQGGDDYLIKPFSLDQVLHKLDILKSLRKELRNKIPPLDLPGVERAKKEIDHRLLRDEATTVCYFTIDEFASYKHLKGGEKAEKVILFLGELILKELKAAESHEFFLSHVGQDHFILILPGTQHGKLLKTMTYVFNKGSREFYHQHEWDSGYIVSTERQGIYDGHSLMDLRICTLKSDVGKYINASAMLRKLRRMQKRSSHEDKELVFSFRQKDKR